MIDRNNRLDANRYQGERVKAPATKLDKITDALMIALAVAFIAIALLNALNIVAIPMKVCFPIILIAYEIIVAVKVNKIKPKLSKLLFILAGLYGLTKLLGLLL